MEGWWRAQGVGLSSAWRGSKTAAALEGGRLREQVYPEELRPVRVGRAVLAGEALLLMVAARGALRMVPVRRVLRFAGQAPRGARPDEAEVKAAVKEVRWAVAAAVRHAPVELVCFPQCLAGLAMLRRRGIGSRLQYGVARIGGKLETHTWLEVDGVTVIGGEVARDFSLLASF